MIVKSNHLCITQNNSLQLSAMLICSFCYFIQKLQMNILSDSVKHKVCKIYLIGNSNTQSGFSDGGFVSQLADRYIRKCDVINRGFNGYTSEYLRHMLPRLLSQDHNIESSVNIATILLGSNDAIPKEESNRHVNLERYRQNLEYIINLLQEQDIKNIILLSPPPVDHHSWDKYLRENKGRTTNFGKEHVEPYADVCRELACKFNLPYIDLFNTILKEENWKEYFFDGLHFSKLGNSFVLNKLVEIIDPIAEDFPTVYPDYKDIIDLDKELLKDVLG